MKTKIYFKSLAVLIASVALASCSDLFNKSDLKNSPNAPETAQVDITPLTTGSLVGIGMLHEDTDTRIAYMWGGQLLGQSRQQKGFQDYIVAASTFDWGNYYNIGQNIRIIQERATKVNNKMHLGVAQVMEAILFAKLVSLWGDVPYSEAFDIAKHPTPKYDGQVAVYNSLIALINTAITNLNSGIGNITGDFMYGNDASKWAAAAKTLQARLYLHLKDYPNAKAAALAGISAIDGDLLMPHGHTYQVDMNLNFSFFDTDRPGDCSFDDPAYLPQFMTTYLGGSRTGDVAVRNAKTDESIMYWHFFTYGYETSGRDPNVADGFFIDAAPQPILTYYENQLILAEALARLNTGAADQGAIDALNSVRQKLATGYIAGQNSGYAKVSMSGKISASTGSSAIVGDKTKFTTELIPGLELLDSLGNSVGIVASITDNSHLTLMSNAAVTVPANRKFMRNGVTYVDYVAGDFDQGGVANPGTTFADGRTALLTEIASEKFVTMISQYEVFNELRRLQVATPVISLGIPITFGSKFPARFIYPQNELNTNSNCPNPAPDQFQKLPVFQ